MTFQEKKAGDFLTFFESVKYRIREFKGCQHIELLIDQKQSNAFSFYSVWEDEQCLEAYRRSAFYREIWSKTKTMFDAPPSSWSYFKYSEA
jgi:quinol monooxygenase YgiN